MVVHAEPLNTISLCTGGGGLDLGLELAIPSARPVCYLEREAFAVAHLVAAMQQGWLAEAPVWSDVTTFRGREWRGLVDGVVGGIPCQPWSLAGRRGGTEDERDLWSDARRIIVQARPWWVLIENVRGMLSAKPGFDPGALRVWRDLQRLGFRVEGGLFTAAEVGASHERERLFILGVADSDGRQSTRWRSGSGEATGRRAHAEPSRSSARVSGVGLADTCIRPAERRRGTGDLARPSGEVEEEARQRQWGRNPASDSSETVPGVGQADTYEPRPQGYGQSGQRARERLARAGGRELVDAERAGLLPAAQSGVCGGEEAAGHGDPDRSGLRQAETSRDDAVDQVDCASNGRGERRPEPAVRSGWRAVSVAGDVAYLFPPGPQDTEAWSAITELAPERLPAISRHDRFRIAIRAALVAAHGDPAKRDWLDPQGPFGLRAALVQEIAQSHLRGMADGLAEARIDWLRLLGNGVVPLEAAHAIRTLATRLAGRGSVGANELVGMMATA